MKMCIQPLSPQQDRQRQLDVQGRLGTHLQTIVRGPVGHRPTMFFLAWKIIQRDLTGVWLQVKRPQIRS